MINQNTMQNETTLYYDLYDPIDHPLLIFSRVFKDIMDSVKKLWVYEVLMSILLKFNSNIFAILFFAVNIIR